MPAHVTLVYPFARAHEFDDHREALASVCTSFDAFTFDLGEARRFDDGLLYLSVSPTEPVTALIVALCSRFPDYPPYGGRFAPEEVIPHCTVALASGHPSGITDEDAKLFDDIERAFEGHLPITSRADEVWLMAELEAGWTISETFSLGGRHTLQGRP